MFYMQYLSGLCQRRQWPEPNYSAFLTPHGYKCTVRVNNREYHTDVGFESQQLAVENAAQRAYLICRNFSMNDGMLPGSKPGNRRQGMPVAIGTERRSIHSDDGSLGSASSSGSRSGGSSPDRADFGYGISEQPAVRRGYARTSGHSHGSSRRR